MKSILHIRLPAEYERGQIDQLLVDKFSFKVEPLISEKWTFYDTFDWCLFNQSLALRHSGQEIILDHLSDGESLNGLTYTSSPGFAWDLPENLLGKRLKSIIQMRALLPLAEIYTSSKIYRILNMNDKTVARLVYTEARTFHPESDPVLATYLSLRSVRGYPKYSRKLAKHLGHAGQVTSMIEDLYFSALEQAGQKPGSYSGKFDLRLKPNKRSDISTKVILRYLFEIMKANEAGIRADIDTEFLHDYRIAIRRTRSALSQIRNVFPAEVTEHFKKEFRTLGQRTNMLRDLDVYLFSENDFQARLPAAMCEDIVPLFDYLRVRREQALEEVIDSLSSSEYIRMHREWEEFLNEPISKKTVAANAAIPIVDLARKRIYKRYRRVIKDGDYILTHTQDELLHALRIECKKLRYLMEFFTSLFPRKRMARLIMQLKKLQDNLGEFNDLSVQQEYLMHMAQDLPIDDPGSRKALVATGYLVENLDYKQKAEKANFAKTFTEFASPANQVLFRRLFATKGKKAAR
ncbi:MAG: CHAD domain-containing protein [Candidatus Promineifilaceae bacterium]